MWRASLDHLRGETGSLKAPGPLQGAVQLGRVKETPIGGETVWTRGEARKLLRRQDRHRHALLLFVYLIDLSALRA